jgi:hypothetical protein
LDEKIRRATVDAEEVELALNNRSTKAPNEMDENEVERLLDCSGSEQPPEVDATQIPASVHRGAWVQHVVEQGGWNDLNEKLVHREGMAGAALVHAVHKQDTGAAKKIEPTEEGVIREKLDSLVRDGFLAQSQLSESPEVVQRLSEFPSVAGALVSAFEFLARCLTLESCRMRWMDTASCRYECELRWMAKHLNLI